MSKLKQLRTARAEIVKKGEAAVAVFNGRDATDEERAAVLAARDELESIEAQIEQAEEQADAERAFTVVADHPTIQGGRDRIEDDPKRGWDSAGQFAMAVHAASRNGGHVDRRLLIGAAPTTYSNEGTGADGGYLIPPAFSERIYEHMLEEDSFLPLTDNDDVSGNGMVFPADETTPWGTDGVRAYWEAEAAQATQTKPVLKQKNMRLHKLFALVPVTEEMLADSAVIDSYIERKAGVSIRWKTQDALVNGTGAGQPVGIANAGCLVTQAKEGSQTADTINSNNVGKMYARNTAPSRAVWLINPDAYNQLFQLTVGDQPVYTLPQSGMTSAPGGFLLGRPVVLTDTCQTLGDLGDIYFVDWQGYKTITKAGGVSTATSMHLWFDYDVSAFRATFRIDGQPWQSAAVTPPNSSVTRSPFVALAARA